MKMRHLLAAAALSVPSLLPAQVVFEATYSVQQRGKDIGTEHVTLRSTPGAGGSSALKLEFEGQFPGSQETLRGSLARGTDGTLDQLQLETRSGSTTETLRAAQRGNRIYITVNSAQGSRGGKEIPGGPGVILLDLVMQGMDGWEFRDRQLRDPALADVPVILMSGLTEIPRHAAQMAVAAHVTKPIELNSLLATVERHCSPQAD